MTSFREHIYWDYVSLSLKGFLFNDSISASVCAVEIATYFEYSMSNIMQIYFIALEKILACAESNAFPLRL